MIASDIGSPLPDSANNSVLADEDKIERQHRVLHPEANRLCRFKNEKHAAPFVHLLAKHQPASALAGVICDFDSEGALSGLRVRNQRCRIDRHHHRARFGDGWFRQIDVNKSDRNCGRDKACSQPDPSQ